MSLIKVYRPVNGERSIKTYGFSLGIYRYQVEQLDKSLYGFYTTNIYKFNDTCLSGKIYSAIVAGVHLNEDDIKDVILHNALTWHEEIRDELQKFFIDADFPLLFPESKRDFFLPYRRCKTPNVCPICGIVDENLTKSENMIDCFNAYVTMNHKGEYEGKCDEVYLCPNCKERFYYKTIF